MENKLKLPKEKLQKKIMLMMEMKILTHVASLLLFYFFNKKQTWGRYEENEDQKKIIYTI